MFTYVDEKRRRIQQFAAHLRLMGLRRHKVVRQDCFTIFSESASDDADVPGIKESAAVVVDRLAAGGAAWEGVDGLQGPPADGAGPESSRYIQFAFMRDCFYLEMPNNTVFPAEARQILQQRRGFYYARSRRDLSWVRANWKDMVQWDPLQKIYLYRDEESAAEDMAFIMFQVWKFPVDWRWYLRSASFHTRHRFERDKPLD